MNTPVAQKIFSFQRDAFRPAFGFKNEARHGLNLAKKLPRETILCAVLSRRSSKWRPEQPT
jgi:hypothetical protein